MDPGSPRLKAGASGTAFSWLPHPQNIPLVRHAALAHLAGFQPPACGVIAMPALSWPHITPILLLIGSNVFMTLAWYGHLKFKSTPILMVILISWSIAFVEYCLAVPANRYGHAVYSAAELKTMQEVITLSVFVIFSWLYLNEPVTVRHLIGFALIAAGAAVIFLKPAVTP